MAADSSLLEAALLEQGSLIAESSVARETQGSPASYRIRPGWIYCPTGTPPLPDSQQTLPASTLHRKHVLSCSPAFPCTGVCAKCVAAVKKDQDSSLGCHQQCRINDHMMSNLLSLLEETRRPYTVLGELLGISQSCKRRESEQL